MHSKTSLPLKAQLAGKSRFSGLHRAAAIDKDGPLVHQLCLRVLTQHDSVKERLPFVESFYSTLPRLCSMPDSMHDLACDGHPFAWPWASLPRSVQYSAYDNIREHVESMAGYLDAESVAARVEGWDILLDPPLDEANIALSLPTQSLAGSARNIADRHRPTIESLAAAHEWSVESVGFSNEQLIVISKSPAG
ncbi:MAG: hypothetical protein AAF449_21575 [Myxococcota bacterium]